MGSLTVPSSGLVYLETNPVIYSVEINAIYWPLLEPLWQAAKAGTVEIVSSDLTLMETLVGPLKFGDTALALAYEQLFQQAQTRLLPITHSVLREAARLRATTQLKTPDALHLAPAQGASCVLFIINDGAFRSVASLLFVILDDLLKP
jgi:predicted nucleic acid-binding protein